MNEIVTLLNFIVFVHVWSNLHMLAYKLHE